MLSAITFLFSSCSKEEIEIAPTHKEGISLKNGYLVFSDYSTFLKTQETISNYSEAELDQWDHKFGSFESQRSIYKKALVADFKHKEKYEELISSGKRELESVIQNGEHITPLVQQNEKLFSFDEDGLFELAIEHYSPNISSFVNKNGVLQIGDSIFHYSDGYIRIIPNGDENKLPLIKTYEENDLDNSIIVLKVNKERINVGDESLKGFQGFNAFIGEGECSNTAGKQRVKGSIFFYRTSTFQPGGPCSSTGDYYYTYQVIFNAVNQYKYWIGWTKKPTGYLRIEGNNITVGYSGPYNFIQTTGGDEDSEISHSIVNYERFCNYFSKPRIKGTAHFYGRGGTKCTL